MWQLMRAYTLAMLDKITGQGHPIVENGIIEWTNKKVTFFLMLKQINDCNLNKISHLKA